MLAERRVLGYLQGNLQDGRFLFLDFGRPDSLAVEEKLGRLVEPLSADDNLLRGACLSAPGQERRNEGLGCKEGAGEQKAGKKRSNLLHAHGIWESPGERFSRKLTVDGNPR